MSQLPFNSPLNYATPDPFGSPIPAKGPFRKGLLGWLVFLGVAVLLVILVQNGKRVVPEISLDEFYDHLLAGDVVSLTVGSDVIDGKFRSPTTLAGKALPNAHFRTQLPTGTVGNWAFTEWLLKNRHGAQLEVSNDAGLLATVVLPLIPWILIFCFIWFFLARVTKKVGNSRLSSPAGPIEVTIVNRDPK